ncbi:ABC transporter permease [bacterium]|nr:ABC transporter permease [bacterium]
MSVWEAVQLCFEAILANRLRSALTMLGIIFGVGAVIGAVSLTAGAKAATLARFEAMGTNSLRIMPGQGRGAIGGGMGSAATLTLEDATAIGKEVSGVTAVSAQVSSSMQVQAGNQNTSTSVQGVGDNYLDVGKLTMAQGRFFTAEESRRRRKVAVLGPTVVENLFGKGEYVVGESLRLKGMTFSIIGVCNEKGSTGPFDPDDTVYVPINTAIYRLVGSMTGAKDSVNGITALAADMSRANQVKAEVTALLRQRHRIKDGDDNDFRIMAAADIVQSAEATNQIMTLLFSSIAIVSLLVGGIGIMNIMLVSVTERTREIGLRKALGATPRDIMLQFLIESMTLSLAGGVLGVVFGIGTAFTVRLFGLNSAVSPPWVFLSFGFAAAVGVVFGLLPAQKAADLDPVEALRYE